MQRRITLLDVPVELIRPNFIVYEEDKPQVSNEKMGGSLCNIQPGVYLLGI